jgi:hypothetical protein
MISAALSDCQLTVSARWEYLWQQQNLSLAAVCIGNDFCRVDKVFCIATGAGPHHVVEGSQQDDASPWPPPYSLTGQPTLQQAPRGSHTPTGKS